MMANFRLTKPYDRQAGFDAAQDIWDLMRRLKRGSVTQLNNYQSRPHGPTDGHAARCVEPDSMYGHLDSALMAVFRQLGLPEGDEWKVREELHGGDCTVQQAFDAIMK